MRDCESKIAEQGDPDVQVFVIQSLKGKTPRRRAGHGGRHDRYLYCCGCKIVRPKSIQRSIGRACISKEETGKPNVRIDE